MDFIVGIWNVDAKYAYKNTMQNSWLKAAILPTKIMVEMRNLTRNNESFNANAGTHDAISQYTYDTDNMYFSSDKEATITASNISSSEDSGNKTKTQY